MELQAGYILANVSDYLRDRQNAGALLKSLCFFEVESTLPKECPTDKPEIAVLHNLISRGLPTRPSIFIEECLYKALVLGERKVDRLGNISFDKSLERKYDNLIDRALHVIDPRIDPTTSRLLIKESFEHGKIGSKYEQEFLFRLVPQTLGKEWFQLLELQREFPSIANKQGRFTEQRTDFSIQFPYPINDKNGIVIEVDGPQHKEQAQAILDKQRDEAVIAEGWLETIRIQTEAFPNIQSKLNPISKLKEHVYFKTLADNYKEPLYKTEEGLKALQMALSPLAIARLQKTILHFLLHGKLNVKDSAWKIAVIERDVPCSIVAITDLQMQLKNLFALKNESFATNINLTVIRSNEFSRAQLNQLDLNKHLKSIEFESLENINTGNKEYDLLLDISVLQRPGFTESPAIKSKNKAIIRTSHHIHYDRSFITADLIKYNALVNYNPQNPEYSVFDLHTIHSLRYFLQTVFRKNTFREGQLEILNKALQTDSVIGLLPTGGGKSLTYQLAALLQPGVCLVIDPIKSLMKDQFDNLKKNHIDACNYINSSLKTREERERQTAKLSKGEMLFSFVSPERLQMKTFRDSLLKMHERKVYFSYCIIDEAHCVSEWGHDFRTSYLSLGKNAIEFCKTKNKQSIPLFGLTATASFDVLSDVQRELSGNNEKFRLKEDSVIRFDSVNREELNFDIIDTEIKLAENDDEWSLKRKLGEQKQTTLIQELRRQPLDNGAKAGIIFCPHRGWFYGVTDRYKINARELNGVYDAIRRAQIPNVMMGSFMGSDSDDERAAVSIEADSIQAQEEFVNNQLNLLVSTKAFGMGIDKPNVRFTFHINYPSSIESFVQEAGRAGRDKEKANCYILFNDQKVKTISKEHEIDRDNLLYFHNSSFKGAEKEKAILSELLSGIYTPDKISEIELKLAEKFGLKFKLSLWKNENSIWWITARGDSSEKYGSIRLSDFHKTTNNADQPLEICNSVLSEIITYINTSAAGNVVEWLNSSDMVEGIETLLKRKNDVSLTLGFHNNTTERREVIRKWLNAAFDTHVFNISQSVDPLEIILSSSNSFVDFKEQVGSKIRGNLTFDQVSHNRDTAKGNQIGTSEKELQRLFHGFRVKSDTEKALYRLSTVGVIDDYTIDFNSKTYTLTATRKSDEEYYKNLENYIRKYYSDVRTKQEIKKARKFSGDTAIQKCLFFLTDFVYREIEKKRFEGIGAMKEACQIGKIRGGVAFKEYIDLYFNSKYARRGYEVAGENKSLTDRSDEGKDQHIKWVWEFIEVTNHDPSGGQINNLKHLRGACVRLLIPQPNNGTLHLLKAFSLFILDPDNHKLMEEASDSFSKGFIELKREHKLPFDSLLKEVEKYKSYVFEFSTHPGIQGIMDEQIEILSIKIHSEWLSSFNDKFLKEYEPGHTYAS